MKLLLALLFLYSSHLFAEETFDFFVERVQAKIESSQNIGELVSLSQAAYDSLSHRISYRSEGEIELELLDRRMLPWLHDHLFQVRDLMWRTHEKAFQFLAGIKDRQKKAEAFKLLGKTVSLLPEPDHLSVLFDLATGELRGLVKLTDLRALRTGKVVEPSKLVIQDYLDNPEPGNVQFRKFLRSRHLSPALIQKFIDRAALSEDLLERGTLLAKVAGAEITDLQKLRVIELAYQMPALQGRNLILRTLIAHAYLFPDEEERFFQSLISDLNNPLNQDQKSALLFDLLNNPTDIPTPYLKQAILSTFGDKRLQKIPTAILFALRPDLSGYATTQLLQYVRNISESRLPHKTPNKIQKRILYLLARNPLLLDNYRSELLRVAEFISLPRKHLDLIRIAFLRKHAWPLDTQTKFLKPITENKTPHSSVFSALFQDGLGYLDPTLRPMALHFLKTHLDTNLLRFHLSTLQVVLPHFNPDPTSQNQIWEKTLQHQKNSDVLRITQLNPLNIEIQNRMIKRFTRSKIQTPDLLQIAEQLAKNPSLSPTHQNILMDYALIGLEKNSNRVSNLIILSNLLRNPGLADGFRKNIVYILKGLSDPTVGLFVTAMF